MSDQEFEQLLAELADEPPVFERFQMLDVESLLPVQQQRLALFLRSQGRLRAVLGGAEPFVARVAAASSREGDRFVQQVMQRQAGRTAPKSVSKPVSRWLPWTVAAAACVAAMVSWLRPAGEMAGTAILAGQPAATEPGMAGAIGVLVNDARAVFAGDDPKTRGFLPGHYQMTQGLAHVRLLNGTDLVLKAPVAFTLRSAMRLHLERGGLRARVPEQAHGFTVATEGVEYRDLGTEFTVDADAGAGESSMHVYDGAVEVYSPTGKKLDQVPVGRSVSFSGGNLMQREAAETPSVPEAETVKYEDWWNRSQQMRQDPSLVAYYSFERDPAASGILKDVKAAGEAVHGTIHKARWVTGRWPGKQALFFDRDDDYVETLLPGSYTRMTVAVWVLLDRLDFKNNALFASNGWQPGAFHLNVSREAQVFGGVYHAGPPSLQSSEKLPLSVWSLVVMTVDEETGKVEGWINGRRVYGKDIEKAKSLVPGLCRIGSCLPPPNEGNPVRTIRGRIDELFVWGRVLSAREITDLYEHGSPNLLELPTMQTGRLKAAATR